MKQLICVACLFLILIPPSFSQRFRTIYAIGDTVTYNGKNYVARSITFQFNKPLLQDPINPTLDSIALFLEKNDSLVIEVGAHGSIQNDVSYCSKLTQRRAQTIVDFLIAKGIPQNRLVARGYGQSKILYPKQVIQKEKDKAKQEWMHRMNRIIEFRILNQ